MPQITVFRNLYETKQPFYTTLPVLVERIRTGKVRPTVELLRAEQDEAERNRLKNSLPSILFAGTFTERLNSAITEHSGLIVLDFDKMGDALPEVRQQLIADPYTHICFISPSGKGLKVVVKIPASITSHRRSAQALRQHFAHISFYDHFEDVARVCFESWDETIFYNPDSKIFEELYTPPAPEAYQPQGQVTEQDRIYDNLKTWLTRKGEHYADGNKHKYLVKLAAACNRFGLDMYITTSRLINDYQNAATYVKSEYFEKLVEKVYKSYAHNHSISFFDQQNTPIDRKINGNPGPTITEDSALDVSIRVQDIIYLDDISERMLHGFDYGAPKGTTTYFPSIDQHWKWKKGELTLMTGIMNHGKSALMMQLCLLKAVAEGTRFAVFSPEQNPPEEFYNDLIHAYLGLSTVKGHHNQANREEYVQGMEFINDHFYFLYPEGEAATPDYINSRFLEAILKHKVEGCIIDPFNQQDHVMGRAIREDQYISDYLTKQKQFALKHDVYQVIIAHPKASLAKIKDGEFKGNYEAPDVFDLAGGAMWGNKCDNILVTHRPYRTTDEKNGLVHFTSLKIKKQKLVGRPGTTEVFFDPLTNRYSDYSGCPMDKYHPISSRPAYTPPQTDQQYQRGAQMPVSEFDTTEEIPF